MLGISQTTLRQHFRFIAAFIKYLAIVLNVLLPVWAAHLRQLSNVRDKPETARQGRRGLGNELIYLRYKKSFLIGGQTTTV